MATTTKATTPVRYLSPEAMFDSIGPAYEGAFKDLKAQVESLHWVLEQVQGRRPAKTLDLGCGTGRPVCSILADAGHDVLGVDVSGVMVECARDRVRNAKFLKADAFQIELPPESFDAITVHFSLAAGSSRDLIARQIGRIYGWLKVGGVLVLATVPNARDQVSDSFLGRKFLGSGLSVEEYIECIRGVGFDVVAHNLSSFKPKAAEVGLCHESDVKEEIHLFVYARKD